MSQICYYYPNLDCCLEVCSHFVSEICRVILKHVSVAIFDHGCIYLVSDLTVFALFQSLHGYRPVVDDEDEEIEQLHGEVDRLQTKLASLKSENESLVSDAI